jgi:hypothetical protein
MSASTIKNLLFTINEFKDECYLNGNISDVLHLRNIERKLESKLKTLE